VDVVLQKMPGERLRNRLEALDDQVDVVDLARRDRPPMSEELSFDGQAPGQPESQPVIEQRRDHLRDSRRINAIEEFAEQ